MRPRGAFLGLLAAFLALSNGFARGEVLSINKFGGLDTENDPLFVDSGKSWDSENVQTGGKFGLSPREGFVSFSTEASAGMWNFPLSNGSSYRITESSGILKALLNGSNFTVIIGTINQSVRTAAATLGDRFYWSSADGLKYWDTSTVTMSSRTLNFTNLVAFKGRLAGAGVTGNERLIYLSEYLNGSNFTLALDPVDTDPTRIPIQGNSNENITTLFSSFQDKLIYTTANSFGGVSGSRRSTFKEQEFSNSVGSAYPESFKDCDGKLRFLGSKKTFWEFDGVTVKPISTTDIDTLMASVTQGDANSRSFSQTSQEDWSHGTSVFTVALDTSIVPGDVYFKPQSTITVAMDDFEDNNYTSSPTWTVISGSAAVVGGILTTVLPLDAALYTTSNQSTGTWELQGPGIWKASGNEGQWLYSFMSNDPTGAPNAYAIRFTKNQKIGFLRRTSVGDDVLLSSAIVGDCTNLRINRDGNGVFTTSVTCNGVTQTMVTVDTWNVTSSYFVIQWSAPEHGISAGYEPQLDRIITSTPSSLYIYKSTFTSQTYGMGSEVTSWGVFFADSILDAGTTISYTIFSDTDGVMNINNASTFRSSQAIASGEVPSIAISSYVTVSAYFDRSTYTATARLNSFTVSWVDGSRLPVPSLYVDGEYRAGVALSSSTNNIVLVYGQDNQWQKWRGINMDSAILYNSIPYFGNAGGIFQADSGHTDDGAPITSYYRTKRFVPAGVNYFSTFDDFYLTTANSAATITVEYFVDGVDTAYTLADYDMDTQEGQQDVRLPFSTTMLQQGNMIDFLFTVSGTTDWHLVNANLYFTPETDPAGE